jgi:hypothetical protein
MSSFARPTPTSAGSREQPPTSGIKPTRVSTRPMTASAAITRRSQARTSSTAPPMQPPWICATVGLAMSSQRFQTDRTLARNSRERGGWAASSPNTAVSIPLENIAPSPRRTTQRTAASSAASCSAEPSASMSARFRAFASPVG